MRHRKFQILWIFGSAILLMLAIVPLSPAVNWSDEEKRLTWDEFIDGSPSMVQMSDGQIWVLWHSYRTGAADIFYNIYDGTSWLENDVRLTYDDDHDASPSILQAYDGTIWVFWTSYRTGNFDIFYKTSSDNGASWSDPPSQVTEHKAWDMNPSAMQALNREIWVAYETERTGPDDDVYYNIYDGSEWSTDTALVTSNSDDFLPCIFQAMNKTIWMAWTTDRDYNCEIYYETTVPNPHDVGVASVSPSSTFAYQGYSIDVHVDVWNYGTNIESFNVTVFGNETVIGVETDVGLAANSYVTLTFPWDVSDVPLGYYVISATVEVAVDDDLSDNSFEDGVVQVRIPGDLNGDDHVNVLDATLLSLYFGKSPSEYPPADINGDGDIDVCDATLLIINWSG